MGVTKPEAGVIATRPATAPAAAPTTLGLPVASQLSSGPDEQPAAAVARCVTTKALEARPPAATSATGVEAEPAEPEDGGADDDHGDVVRLHRLTAEAVALAVEEGGHQGRRYRR